MSNNFVFFKKRNKKIKEGGVSWLSTIGLRKEERKRDNSTFFTVGEGSKRIVIILTMIALIAILISVSITVLGFAYHLLDKLT